MYEDTAQLKIIDAPAAAHENLFNVQSYGDWSNRFVSGFTITAADGNLAAAHAIKAHIVRPIRLKFSHTYYEMKAIVRNITVETANDISNMSTVSPIDVQVAIENVTLTCNLTVGE